MTANIMIRAREAGDVPAIVALRNQAGVRRNTLAVPYESVAAAQARVVAMKNVTWLVACVDDEVVGTAAVHRASPARRAHVGSLGIMVGEGWQGRGVGSALFAALTELADHWLNIARLELCVFTDNAAGLALYRKFGFEVEGVERADAVREGVLTDSFIMARLRPGLAADVSAPPPLPAPAPVAPWALRAVEPEDLAGVTALMNCPGVRYGTLRAPFTAEDVVRHLVTPPEGYRNIVAVVGERVVGMAVLAPAKGRRAHVGEVSLLAVHDAYARRGIGRALLGAVLEVADDWLGLRRLTLNVLADNAGARALYEAQGFAVEGRRRADVFRCGGYADALAMGRLRGV